MSVPDLVSATKPFVRLKKSYRASGGFVKFGAQRTSYASGRPWICAFLSTFVFTDLGKVGCIGDLQLTSLYKPGFWGKMVQWRTCFILGRERDSSSAPDESSGLQDVSVRLFHIEIYCLILLNLGMRFKANNCSAALILVHNTHTHLLSPFKTENIPHST